MVSQYFYILFTICRLKCLYADYLSVDRDSAMVCGCGGYGPMWAGGDGHRPCGVEICANYRGGALPPPFFWDDVGIVPYDIYYLYF